MSTKITRYMKEILTELWENKTVLGLQIEVRQTNKEKEHLNTTTYYLDIITYTEHIPNKQNIHFSQIYIEHFWGYIRAIKSPNTLREITNPQICVK